MKQKIYIVGCARSGTTLLLRLFNAFESVAVIPKEIGISNFVKSGNDLSKNMTLVGKRTGSTVFSASVSEKSIKEQLKLIEDNNVKIVNIVRDGRDVVESRYTGCPRWISSMDYTQRFFLSHVTHLVRYEELVRYPNQVQTQIAKVFDLKSKHKWSDYPEFVGEEFFEATKSNGPQYEPRPIDQVRVGKNLDFYKEVCPPENIDEFENTLKAWGYV